MDGYNKTKLWGNSKKHTVTFQSAFSPRSKKHSFILSHAARLFVRTIFLVISIGTFFLSLAPSLSQSEYIYFNTLVWNYRQYVRPSVWVYVHIQRTNCYIIFFFHDRPVFIRPWTVYVSLPDQLFSWPLKKIQLDIPETPLERAEYY